MLVSAASFAGAADTSPDDLLRRSQERRAVEAVIWRMPAVNTELMYDQMVKAGGKPGQIIYWGKPLDWRNQTLTPNPDTLGHPRPPGARASGSRQFRARAGSSISAGTAPNRRPSINLGSPAISRS